MLLGLLTTLQDTPASCVQDQFYGRWRVSLAASFVDVKSDRVECANGFNVSETLEVDLLERGVALTTSGEVRSGRWTPVANQGFEVRLGPAVYFFFSDWDDESGASNCAKTRYGYANSAGLVQQRTFRCASAELVRPAVSDIRPLEKSIGENSQNPRAPARADDYEEPEGHKMWVGSDLPVNFSWGDVNGVSYLPPVFD